MTHPEPMKFPNDYWPKIYAKAWLDDGFRRQLEINAVGALKAFADENGIAADHMVSSPSDSSNGIDENVKEILKGNSDYSHPPPACC